MGGVASKQTPQTPPARKYAISPLRFQQERTGLVLGQIARAHQNIGSACSSDAGFRRRLHTAGALQMRAGTRAEAVPLFRSHVRCGSAWIGAGQPGRLMVEESKCLSQPPPSSGHGTPPIAVTCTLPGATSRRHTWYTQWGNKKNVEEWEMEMPADGDEGAKPPCPCVRTCVDHTEHFAACGRMQRLRLQHANCNPTRALVRCPLHLLYTVPFAARLPPRNGCVRLNVWTWFSRATIAAARSAKAMVERPTCALRAADGGAVCWGSNRHGRATPPDEGEAYDTIDAGAFGEHTCAIVRPGGGARCWGRNHHSAFKWIY
eukprot:gene50361-biopygen117118